jgi:hypothetical protein
MIRQAITLLGLNSIANNENLCQIWHSESKKSEKHLNWCQILKLIKASYIGATGLGKVSNKKWIHLFFLMIFVCVQLPC